MADPRKFNVLYTVVGARNASLILPSTNLPDWERTSLLISANTAPRMIPKASQRNHYHIYHHEHKYQSIWIRRSKGNDGSAGSLVRNCFIHIMPFLGVRMFLAPPTKFGAQEQHLAISATTQN
jgi:hypothetical protein